MQRKLMLGFCLSAPLWLAACGSGGSGDTGGVGLQPTASVIGVSSGAITGFGSVFVNGVRYNSNNAVVFRGEDQINDVRDLQIGMIVRLEGDLGNKVASRIHFEEDVKGPADGTATGNNFSVMGQTIITDRTTVFNNTSLTAIAAGDIFEISGLRNESDAIVARFVERKNDPGNVNQFNVIGHVSNLNANTKTFQIDDLSIDYSAANVNDLPSGDPAEGQLVEVKDDNKAYVPGSLSLTATKVEPKARLGSKAVAGAKIEIETIVTRVNSPTEFEIGGITVRTSTSTRFLFGTADNVTVGVRLEVEGIIDNSGVLKATKVKFEDKDVRIQANVDVSGVDPTPGTVTLLGIPVTVTNQTDMEDKRDNISPFSVSDIQGGDALDIRGFVGANGAFVATELSRDNADSKVEIRGPATAKDAIAGTVTILGLTVNTDGNTQFVGFDDQRVSPTQFFEAIFEGLTIVEAKWDPFTNVNAVVKELELED